MTDEEEADRNASNLYEEAVRAEALGKKMMAQQLAQQALDVSPNGRYSPAIGRLLDRLTSQSLSQSLGEEPTRKGDAAVGSRVAYVVSGGLIGGAAGALFAGAAQGTSGSLIAGIGLVGAVVGVGLTLATMSAVDDGSIPTHLWSWGTFGLWVAGSVVLLSGPNPSANAISGLAGAGLTAGAVVGALLGGLTNLTVGDGTAGLVLGSLLIGEVLLIEGSDILATNPDANTASQVVGGTSLALAIVGYLGGELLNHQIHWSGGRWGLIFLSAALGAAVAGLLSGVTNSNASTTLGLLAGGEAVGFGVGCVSTLGMSPEGAPGTAPPFSGQVQGMSMPATPRATLAWTF